MQTLKTLTLAAFIGLASAASDSSVLENSAAQNTARTIFTSGGTYYLALNATYLIYYGILIGMGLLAILAIGSLTGGASANQYGSQQQYGYSRQGQAYQDELLYRQRRFAEGKYQSSALSKRELAFFEYKYIC